MIEFLFLLTLIVTSSSEAPATLVYAADNPMDSVIVKNVPAYMWHHGCVPTVLGTIVGYWDNLGFDFVEGNATAQTGSVNQIIASDEHYSDYSLPLDYKYKDPYPIADRSATPESDEHVDNSIADFTHTSQSIHDLYYGFTIYHTIGNDMERFVKHRGYNLESKTYLQSEMSWEAYRNEIDHGRPVALLVSTHDWPSHLVVGVGYSENPDRRYGAYSTWSREIVWFDWIIADMDTPWSVWSMITFKISTSLYFPMMYKGRL